VGQHENTTADRIVLDEKSGNFTAEGHVNSSRMPDQKNQKADSAMLSGDEPLQAVARYMNSSNHNKLVKYDGGVMLWQGANRIQAKHVEIDRDKRSIVADGDVVTQSREEKKQDSDDTADESKTAAAPKTAAATKPAPATKTANSAKSKPANTGKPSDAPADIFTLVKAPHMVYTDEDRLAHYSGGVVLIRAGLQVKAADVRSWLAEEGADSRLEKAFADGNVQVVQAGPVRTRTGTSEHAEYYTGDEKVILRGGDPQLFDTLRGNTHGAELTYYATTTKLLVNGSAKLPTISHIRRKHP